MPEDHEPKHEPQPEPRPEPEPDRVPEPPGQIGGKPPEPAQWQPVSFGPASPQATARAREGDIDWKPILERAGCYPVEAFHFVREGLGHTVERARVQHEASLRGNGGAGLANPEMHHVSGQQLCLGLRDYAILQYGMLAPAVLRHWNIVRTEDFGRIVYAMITGGLMSKTADDSIDDFAAVYDFEEAFSDAHLSQRIGG